MVADSQPKLKPIDPTSVVAKVVAALQSEMDAGTWGSFEVVLQAGRITLYRHTKTVKLDSGDKYHE